MNEGDEYMFKKSNTGLIRQINVRFNLMNPFDNEIWTLLEREEGKRTGSKNDTLKRVLYRGLTGHHSLYTNIRDLEDIAENAITEERLSEKMEEVECELRKMIHEEFAKIKYSL